MINIYINKEFLVLASLLFSQAVSGSELAALNTSSETERASNEHYLCSNNNYSNSKFDYRAHYVTSLRFTLPENNCLPKSTYLLDEKSFGSGD